MITIKLIHPIHGIIDQQVSQRSTVKRYCDIWKSRYGRKYFECEVDKSGEAVRPDNLRKRKMP